jgi:DNA-directed RNA polymerase specialized sigma24 family protein
MTNSPVPFSLEADDQRRVFKIPETPGAPESLLTRVRFRPAQTERIPGTLMLRTSKNRRTKKQAAEYATRSDFQQIFTEDMAGLHLLAFLLTADAQKAEQCFVAGLEESIRGNAVFRQWARSWSKRAIIKNAIKVVSPALGQPGLGVKAGSVNVAAGHARIEVSSAGNEDAPGKALIGAVTRLDSFERFVLVMAVLEDYSVRECSALLGCPGAEVAAAKSRAIEQIVPPPASAQTDRANATVSWASFLAPAQLA